MEHWNIIMTFTYPHEAHIVKGKLEAEGITTKIEDELTAQINNFYSNAIGGVKLLVKDNDINKAYDILVESGYIIPESPSENKLLTWIDSFTSKFPLIP